MNDKLHKVAAVAGIMTGMAPVAGALPASTPQWLQITMTALGLLTTLVVTAGKVFGSGTPKAP
jgi:hypothetical protein